MSLEIECKIPVPELASLSRRLRELGAVFRGAARERNEVFDAPDGRLMREGVLLRLRRWPGGRPDGCLTVKTPATDGAFKHRVERESRVDAPQQVRESLVALGFSRVIVYEKDREEWDFRNARVALDRCPEIGCFIEVEGSEDVIRTVLTELGVDPDGHVSLSYLELWRDHLDRRGEGAWRDMVFETTFREGG